MRLLLAACLLALATPVFAAGDDEKDARALVERWLRDQNTGNFEDYQSLYAEHFFGVRRSGPREVHFDRAGWMKDRRRMFNPRRPATVSIIGLTFQPTANGGQVRFTQKFSQGTFRDAGTKHMLLRREGNALRIADERMLDSTVGGNAPGDVAGWSGALGIVTREGVVLPYKPDKSWAGASKPHTKVSRDGRQVTRFSLREEHIPADARTLVGQSLELVTPDGKTCTAKVKRIALLAVVSVQTYEYEGHVATGPDVPLEYDADADPDEAPRLVAELESGCKDALIARRAGSTGKIVAARKVDAGSEAAAVAATRALPAYAAVGAKDPAQKGTWDTEAEVRSIDVETSGNLQHWVSVSLYGGGGCEQTPRELWALYAVEHGKLTLINDPGVEAVVPSLLLDLDGDGRPEVIFRRGGDENLGYDLDGGVVRRKGKLLDTVDKVRNRYLGCPC